MPEDNIRTRFARLFPLVASAISRVDSAVVYDNSRARTPFRVVARFEHGALVGEPEWPSWTPEVLRKAGR